MKTHVHLPFFTLILLISFASVNAVFFTPALPEIARFFTISAGKAQLTITLFLIGYTMGQLIYGPIANRFGRKPALFSGISIQIISSFLCVFSGYLHWFPLLIIGRFFLAIGSGVGLKMTYTLVNECYEPKIASQKISYLMLAFAIMPGLSIALGGALTNQFGWISCFYAAAVYGVVLLFLIARLPETYTTLDQDALKWKSLQHHYAVQFKNFRLVAAGLLMGLSTTFVYVFSAISPFIAINLLKMTTSQYGNANLLPMIGLLIGSPTSAYLTKIFPMQTIVRTGICIALLGVIIMWFAIYLHLSAVYLLFMPMIIIYFGLCFILANASTLGMSETTDKAHASAIMSFINMGVATLIVLSLTLIEVNIFILPSIYLLTIMLMFFVYPKLIKK